jgi:putative DNA methylase
MRSPIEDMTATITASTQSRVQPRLIETDAFDIAFLSRLAEKESWRKEIHRPIYHVHKWWAKRLGSVFRGILIGCNVDPATDIRREFYKARNMRGRIVLDPFMGSGTTVGEAHKLGFTALGQDINPVACRAARVALGALNPASLRDAFNVVDEAVGARIRNLYRSIDSSGQPATVLYYFWVKSIQCNHCAEAIDLFPNRIVARNAYPAKRPEIQVCCPGCGDIYQEETLRDCSRCRRCGCTFDPAKGNASRNAADCSACGRRTVIVDAVRSTKRPPDHRLFGKLLLRSDGTKEYLSAQPDDLEAIVAASRELKEAVASGTINLPEGNLRTGYNTKQALNYNYARWRDFFNDRQLLALGLLQHGINQVPRGEEREALLVLFSGVLEFNNMFASYKGEGTGAVRHMFSHHVLKPERVPIEANVWGTDRSSGSFSTLFESRLLRAAKYQASPTELSADGRGHVSCGNAPFSEPVKIRWPYEGNFSDHSIYVRCHSSHDLALPDGSVDLIVTDPPFFDNVHYSELADFFYAWHMASRGRRHTTRDPAEVQDVDVNDFRDKLSAVLRECHRVLVDEGILAFTYHHSRPDGWSAVAQAIVEAGFTVTAAQPMRSEMTVAAPKSQAKEPIQIDVVLVCRKVDHGAERSEPPSPVQDRVLLRVRQLESAGMKLSKADLRAIGMAEIIANLPSCPTTVEAAALVESAAAEVDSITGGLQSEISLSNRPDGKAQLDFSLG